jgi:hypothetical protein
MAEGKNILVFFFFFFFFFAFAVTQILLPEVLFLATISNGRLEEKQVRTFIFV